MSTQRVTAILVVHDGATWLPETVASIASQTRSADRVMAIDTGSVDASAKLLKGARIPIIALDREVGFGEAVTHAVSQLPPTTDSQSEWLWILHDDCALDKRALERLLQAVAERPNVAIAGPKLLGWHDRTHLLEVGISLATNGARWTGLEPNEYDQGQRDGIHEVLAVSTAGALIRRDVYEELGGFDKNLELFRDDVDFGWRARVAGHSVIIVTDARGFHAQASATERRNVDVKGALLHRPLLLDRRNAAYVLLANSSIWILPLLVIQLLAGSIFRSIGYLFAKLPGYASDEILAVLSLIIKPAELIAARRARKLNRFISSRVIAPFIPSRYQQFRSSLTRAIESFRVKLLPDHSEVAATSALEINEDEDLLTPAAGHSWFRIFTQPIVAVATVVVALSLVWSRHRLGSLSGGALALSPQNSVDLFKLYIASWHDVAMGSGLSTPVWVVLVGIASFLTFGNVALFISLLFLAAPLLLLLSAHRFLKRFSSNGWLTAGAGALYAFSPISIAAINSGRLGLLIFLLGAPFALQALLYWHEIHTWSLRKISGTTLLIWLLYSFNPSVLLMVVSAIFFSASRDYLKAGKNWRDQEFLSRITRYVTLLFVPFLLEAPHSFSIFIRPLKLVGEIGIPVAGGGPNMALLANPGGLGSLPWWCISPITVVLMITFFSSTVARRFATLGMTFLLAGVFLSSFVAIGNGSTAPSRVSSGTFIGAATLLAIVAAVAMFDKIKARLEKSHINYRHVAIASVLSLTFFYSITALSWLVTAGADSPLRATSKKVLPAFLAIEKEAKTVVLRPYRDNGDVTLSYYISRGRPVTLGEPDVAPANNRVLSQAIEGLVDNTGVASSAILANYGIKYVYLKNPVLEDVAQTIDGLGGFSRTSATKSGIVWKVIKETGRLTFVDYSGKVSVLQSQGVRAFVDNPGTLTLAETYSDGWQVFQDGFRAAKIKNDNGLPTFEITSGGEISIAHEGRVRRGWISFFIIVLTTMIVLALPAGRRKSQIADRELA